MTIATRKKKRNNKSIECCRMIAALMIVAIHCPIDNIVGAYAMSLSRAAVPFFLMTSGYFAYNINIRQWRKRIEDVIRIVVVGGVACILWNCANSYIQNGEALAWSNHCINTLSLVELILFNRATFLNSVYYYFFMLLYVYLIYRFVFDLKLKKRDYYLVIPLLAASFYILKYSNYPWYYAGNWLLTGIPFFFIGHLIHADDNLRMMLKSREWIVIFAGAIISFTERSLFGGGYINAGAIIIAFGSVVFSVNHPSIEDIDCSKTSNVADILSWLGTNCSLVIIIFHCQVRDTLKLFFDISDTWMSIMVLGTSLILALFIYAISFSNNSSTS